MNKVTMDLVSFHFYRLELKSQMPITDLFASFDIQDSPLPNNDIITPSAITPLASDTTIQGNQSIPKDNKQIKPRNTMTLQGHTDGVWTVAFSPNGARLASAS